MALLPCTSPFPEAPFALEGQHMDNWAQTAPLGLGLEIPMTPETGPKGWLRKGAWRNAQKGLISSDKLGEIFDRVKYVLL